MADLKPPCSTCGKPIPDEDFESGSAITVLGQRYCLGCKGPAMQKISLDDLVGSASPPAPRLAPPPPSKSGPPAGSGGSKAPGATAVPSASGRSVPLAKSPSVARRAAARRASSRLPLFLAGAAGGLAVVVAALVFALRGSGSPDPGVEPRSPDRSAERPSPAKPPKKDPAEEAFLRVDALAARSQVSPDEVLSAVEAARAACRGTPWEPKLGEIRDRALADKDRQVGSRELDRFLQEVKPAVLADASLERYGELIPKVRAAREIASRISSPVLPEIQRLHQDYGERYELAATGPFKEIEEAAAGLASEKRYDSALAKIESFPPHLRLSGAWKTLENLKREIEESKKKAAGKK
jgi:hypothetical protein